jgi:hypothetical protein
LESKGLTATPAKTSAKSSACDRENVRFPTAESRQDDEGEGEAGTPLDLPALDLERLADQLRARLSPDDCRQLAELLMATRRDGAEG